MIRSSRQPSNPTIYQVDSSTGSHDRSGRAPEQARALPATAPEGRGRLLRTGNRCGGQSNETRSKPSCLGRRSRRYQLDPTAVRPRTRRRGAARGRGRARSALPNRRRRVEPGCPRHPRSTQFHRYRADRGPDRRCARRRGQSRTIGSIRSRVRRRLAARGEPPLTTPRPQHRAASRRAGETRESSGLGIAKRAISVLYEPLPGDRERTTAMNDKRNPSAESPETELLRADRDLTREELGQTIAELTDKFDVRGRVEGRLRETAETARAKATGVTGVAQERAVQLAAVANSRRVPLAAAIAVVIAALVAWLILRDRRSR
ncbi:hypothetical protein DMB37_04190 [Nocardia sp. CS682]|nr:hypothetical protein DMB37_04190 [Nocardia sp. CS682]